MNGRPIQSDEDAQAVDPADETLSVPRLRGRDAAVAGDRETRGRVLLPDVSTLGRSRRRTNSMRGVDRQCRLCGVPLNRIRSDELCRGAVREMRDGAVQ